jgi:hypothetical protein
MGRMSIAYNQNNVPQPDRGDPLIPNPRPLPPTSTPEFWNQFGMHEGCGRLLREELRRASAGKWKAIMDMLRNGAFRGGDMRAKLMIILQVILSTIDDGIIEKLNDLRKVSEQLKNVDSAQMEAKPGTVSGMNTESSILQSELTMLIQRRQQMIDNINNAIKSLHDTEMNAVRRMV